MTEERKTKSLYAAIEGEIIPCTGYECPGDTDYWWVPALGFSGAIGHSLFEDKESAVKSAVKYLEGKIFEAKAKLNKLKRL